MESLLKKVLKSSRGTYKDHPKGEGSSNDSVQRGKKQEDPPSKLDIDLQKAVLKPDRDRNNLPSLPESSTAGANGAMKNADEVLCCGANASFQWKSTLLSRFKMKSRLTDPPEDVVSGERRLERVGRLPLSKERVEEEEGESSSVVAGERRSGRVGKLPLSKEKEEEEEDPSSLDDGSDKYRRGKGNHSAWTWIQFLGLFLIIVLLVCTLYIHALKKRSLWKLRLWKWEVLILALISGRLILGWGIKLIVFFIERKFFSYKRILYFVYGIRKPVQNCCWLGLVLMAWCFLIDNKLKTKTKSDILRYVTKVLVCLLLGSALWLVKTSIVKMIASSFHVSNYFDRIRESLLNQFVIETLYGLPLIENQRTEEDEERTAAEIRKLQTRGDHLHKLNLKDISPWSMKRLINMVRHDSPTQIKSEFEAEAAAQKIFRNVAQAGSE